MQPSSAVCLSYDCLSPAALLVFKDEFVRHFEMAVLALFRSHLALLAHMVLHLFRRDRLATGGACNAFMHEILVLLEGIWVQHQVA